MRLRKLSVVLLALLLAAMAMVPMVSAGDQEVRSADSDNITISEISPEHQIPDDYLKDSKPAEWIPESEMMNIILSQKTVEKYGQNSKSDIIEIPLTYLESKSNFADNKKFPGYNVEQGINPSDSIILIRMPVQLYETYIKEDVDGKLSLPSTYFCRFYSNLDDLSSHIQKVGKTVKITPSSQYPVPSLSDDESNLTNSKKSASGNLMSTSISKIGDMSTSLSVPQNYYHWVRSWRTSSTNYKYSIGQIRPYSWSLSGSGADLFKLYTEREYKFNNGEALEIVVQYRARNEGAGIKLFPALYRNGAEFPIPTTGSTGWSYWGGDVIIDPNDIPHAYGYHVQITNSGNGYQVNFEDMETLQWLTSYTVTAASTVSSFTELDGSSEYQQLNVPSTDTFSATTSPVIDEWVIDINDGWHKPSAVWQTPTPSPTTPPLYVSVIPSWDSSGNLITRSYANFP